MALTPYYQDDWATIYHGDCFEVIPHLEGIGALMTDPPYSSGGQFRGDRMQSTLAKYVDTDSADQARLTDFAGDTRDQRGFYAWASLWLMAIRNAASPGAPCVVFSDWRQLPVMTDAIQAGGWIWRGIATWHKPGIRMQRGRFSASAEYLLYGTNGAPLDHDGAPQNVFACPPMKGKRQHIAEKPVEVLRWAFQVVPPGMLVLDPFMGSGTTIRAGKDLGFRVVGIEAVESYCEIAANRLQQEVMDFTT